jgi:hypothetical protein
MSSCWRCREDPHWPAPCRFRRRCKQTTAASLLPRSQRTCPARLLHQLPVHCSKSGLLIRGRQRCSSERAERHDEGQPGSHFGRALWIDFYTQYPPVILLLRPWINTSVERAGCTNSRLMPIGVSHAANKLSAAKSAAQRFGREAGRPGERVCCSGACSASPRPCCQACASASGAAAAE